mgnify:CR=1 FL=1
MKKIFIALTCVLMFSQVSFAECNIAVVDLQKVVDNSAQVKTLKNEHTAKIKELNGIITKAQEEIAKQTDTKKIVEIQDKYTNQFNNKKSEIDKIYSSKLANIETQIKSEIEKKAKADGYDFVFAKSVALYGGKDITSEISGMVK